MTEQQFKFAQNILKNMSKLQAAIDVGVPIKSAGNWAFRTLKNQSVITYLQEEREKLKQRTDVSEDYVTQSFKDIFERCMQRAPVMEFDRETRSFVQATDEEGRNVWTFDSTGAVRAMENLAKHINYYDADNKSKAPVIKVAIIGANDFDDQITEEGEIVDDRAADQISGGS